MNFYDKNTEIKMLECLTKMGPSETYKTAPIDFLPTHRIIRIELTVF